MKIKTPFLQWTALLALPLMIGLASADDDKPRPERPPGGGRQGQPFEAIDTDKSGDISEEEFIAAQTKRIKEMFTRIDENGDGKVTKEEMGRMMMRGGQRQEGRPQGRPEGRPERKPDGEKPAPEKEGEKKPEGNPA